MYQKETKIGSKKQKNLQSNFFCSLNISFVVVFDVLIEPMAESGPRLCLQENGLCFAGHKGLKYG